MDDELERPTVITQQEDQDVLHGETDFLEEEGVDWSKLPKGTAGLDRAFIPKRGEKDYEPNGGPSSDSNFQKHVLDKARHAMYQAIRGERSISNKSLSYALWFPCTAHAEVIVSRGTLFGTIGFSNIRDSMATPPVLSDPNLKRSSKGKHLELLPEEALYMIERGSMYCWRIDETGVNTGSDIWNTTNTELFLEEIPGAPMSVSQAFAEMIGPKGDLTVERYQVYAYLKRLGYSVIRAQTPSGIPGYPVAASDSTRSAPDASAFACARVTTWLYRLIGYLLLPFRNPHLPITYDRPLISDLYRSPHILIAHVYQNMKLVLAGFGVPLRGEMMIASSPYTPFYHVYKPSTSFKKTSPPAPDFHLAVVNAQDTPLPDLTELTDLFDRMPNAPFTPKKRVITNGRNDDDETPSTLWDSILASLNWLTPRKTPSTPASPNAFLSLKTGRRNVVVAAVDRGSISFVRFNQGCFEDWPMFPLGITSQQKRGRTGQSFQNGQ